METISGLIRRINYYNDETGYTVATLELDYSDKTISMIKKKVVGNTIAIVGIFDREPTLREEYILEGEFIRDKNYGLQFKIANYTRKLVNSVEGIISYLTSPLFPGIGEKSAKVIIEQLGVECLFKIKQDSSVLDIIKLTDKQKQTIVGGLKVDDLNQENTVFFLDKGISLDMSHKIIGLFGSEAKEIVLNNPYILMEKIERFGFKKNDAFALRVGIKEDSLIRLVALTTYVLREAIYSIGNSFIPKNDLFNYISRYLGKEISYDTYNKVLDNLSNNNVIYIDEDLNIYDYKMYNQELDLAKELSKMLKGTRAKNKKPKEYSIEDINENFQKIKSTSHIEYSSEQELAILSAFTEPLVIITGGPGTGKTTIIKAIIEMYLKLNNDNQLISDYIALLAPTGKASKRLKESTNMPTQTIHRFLGYDGGTKFTYDKFNKTNALLIIVDEASMMDLPLASQLVTSMQPNARLIIVGDVDQLPSVGPGQVLKDLIDSKEVKTVRLTKIHRQAEDSNIIKLAHNINEGFVPLNLMEKLHDRTFISTDNEYIPSLIVETVKRFVSKGYDIKKDIQVLCPMYKGDSGINALNGRIQDIINPYNETEQELKHYGNIFRINDKVIQLVNRAEKGIMNGDVGFVKAFKHKDSKVIAMEVQFDSFIVEYSLDEIEDLSLAYAVSVHKAQGGEFDVVIMPMTSAHYIMLRRKLVYTAVTRAKRSLILIGDPVVLSNGIKKIEANRLTILKDKLIEYLNPLDSNKTNDSIGEEFTSFSIEGIDL